MLLMFVMQANQSIQRPPITVKRSTVTTSSPRKPPLPPAGRSNSTVYSTTTSTVLPRRSAASRYSTEYDDDVDMMPPTPVTRSVIRASSVPPRLPAATSTRTSSYTVNHDVPVSTTTYWTSKPLPPPTNGPKVVHWSTGYPNGVNYNTYITEVWQDAINNNTRPAWPPLVL